MVGYMVVVSGYIPGTLSRYSRRPVVVSIARRGCSSARINSMNDDKAALGSNSSRLEGLASDRRARPNASSVLYFGNRTVPELVKANPPSIWAPQSPRTVKPSVGFLASAGSSMNVLKELMRRYDISKDGVLSEAELQTLIEEMFQIGCSKVALDKQGVRAIMQAMDTDKNGNISAAEFSAAIQGWLGRALMPVHCLLIIDMQNDFITGTLAVKGAEALPAVINRIRKSIAWDVVSYSLDWHPTQHASFYESFIENKPGSRPAELHPSATAEQRKAATNPKMFGTLPLMSPTGEAIDQVLWPRHCAQGSWGAENHVDLVTLPSDIVIRKGTDPQIDSYSAFYDNMKLRSTGLKDQLVSRRVSHVYIVGIAFDFCVCFSALHAAEEGLVVTVIEDATRPVAQSSAAQMRSVMRDAVRGICTWHVARGTRMRMQHGPHATFASGHTTIDVMRSRTCARAAAATCAERWTNLAPAAFAPTCEKLAIEPSGITRLDRDLAGHLDLTRPCWTTCVAGRALLHRC